MIIRKASKKDKVEAINLAEGLPEWFDRVGMESLRVDLEMNHLVVAVEKNEIVGFSCYSSYGGRMILMWFGVKKEYHRKGIGKKLLDWIEEESKKLKLNYIELETLPEEYPSKYYEQTRNFYYKNGFKRVFYRKASVKGWDDQIILEKEL